MRRTGADTAGWEEMETDKEDSPRPIGGNGVLGGGKERQGRWSAVKTGANKNQQAHREADRRHPSYLRQEASRRTSYFPVASVPRHGGHLQQCTAPRTRN